MATVSRGELLYSGKAKSVYRCEAPDRLVMHFRDDTSAHLRGVIDLHAPSTAKLDLLASWTEPRDDPALPRPDVVEASTE